MENATKALLIAAAILIAILIISMGIVVYRNSAEQVNNANLSDVEKTAFNSKFEQYAGTQSKANVKALAKLVLNNNLNNDNKVTFKFGKDEYISTSDTSLSEDFDTDFSKSTYVVGFTYNKSTGLIEAISAQ